MRITRIAATVFLFCLALPLPLATAQSKESLVVSADWLAKHIEDRNLVLLHVGPQYDVRHIPGARLVALSDISVSDPSGLRLEMLAADELRRRLEALGVSDDSRVVVYFAAGAISAATRLMFTLDYAGLGDRASLLDGGLEAWVRAGHAVGSAPPAPKTGTLAPLKIKSSVVDADFVAKNLKARDVAIVDARLAAFYDGTQTGGSAERRHLTGHIAGASSVPFTAITTEQQTLLPADALRALFTGAGIKPGDTVVVYCHIGQQATATALAARTLGHRVLLYDGSFEDWSRRELPVESGPKPPR